MSNRKQNQTRRQWQRYMAKRLAAYRRNTRQPWFGSQLVRIGNEMFICQAQRGKNLVVQREDGTLGIITVTEPLYARDFGQLPTPDAT